MILFDEIDKPMVGTPRETPWDALHSLFEPENAVAFRDEYCDMAFDARHLVSIATANDIDALPVSLVDRLLVVDVQPPTLEQRRLIAATLYVRQQAEAADVLAPELEPDTLDALAALSPRASPARSRSPSPTPSATRGIASVPTMCVPLPRWSAVGQASRPAVRLRAGPVMLATPAATPTIARNWCPLRAARRARPRAR